MSVPRPQASTLVGRNGPATDAWSAAGPTTRSLPNSLGDAGCYSKHGLFSSPEGRQPPRDSAASGRSLKRPFRKASVNPSGDRSTRRRSAIRASLTGAGCQADHAAAAEIKVDAFRMVRQTIEFLYQMSWERPFRNFLSVNDYFWGFTTLALRDCPGVSSAPCRPSLCSTLCSRHHQSHAVVVHGYRERRP